MPAHYLNATRSLFNRPCTSFVHKRLLSARASFKILESKVDLDSKDAKARRDVNRKLEETLASRREKALQGGGPKGVKRHVMVNKKVFVYDRLKMLLDEDYPLFHIGMAAGLGLDYGDVPSAGIVSGIAKIGGQLCVVGANDATIKGGSVFPITVKKKLRMQEIAMENRLPCVYLVDSGGGFLPLQSELYPDIQHGGRVFYNQAVMSGAGVPQVCIVAGSSTAGGAYLPTMCDEAIIVHKIGSLFLGGPPLVQAATGAMVSSEELGGASVHCQQSGSTDYFATDETDAINQLKEIMGTLNVRKYHVDLRVNEEPRYNVEDLNDLAGFDVMSRDVNIYDVLARVLDGSRFHEFKDKFGRFLVTGFGHLHGYLVGVVANNGPLGYKECLKGAHFVEVCSQRKIPLVFLHNNEFSNELNDPIVINAKSKMISMVATTQVPKFSIVIGKSFGMDNVAMCGRSQGPRFMFCWPQAQVSMCDPSLIEEGLLESEEEGQTSEKDIQRLVSTIREQGSAFYLESRMLHDGVILPADSRKVLGLCLEASSTHCRVEESDKSVLRM